MTIIPGRTYAEDPTRYDSTPRSYANSSANELDVGYDVVLLFGQSNAAGVDTIDPLLDAADGRVQQFASSGSKQSQIISGADPLWHFLGASGVSPGNTFAKLLARSRPSNRAILLVPVGVGGTGFTTTSLSSPPDGTYVGAVSKAGTWRVGGPGVNLLDFSVAQATAAVNLNPNNRFLASLWVQGEADTALTDTQYGVYLDALIDHVRSSIPTAQNSIFITGSILPEYVTMTGYAAPVQKGLVNTPARKTLTGHAPAPGTGYVYLSDGLTIHFNAAGARKLGVNSFDAYLRAKANITFRPPVPPPGAITITQSGTSATATWNLPACRITDFGIQKNVNAGGWTNVADPASIENSVVITGLTKGQPIQVRVASINEQGTSNYTTSSAFTLATNPATPTGLTSSSVTGGLVNLTWDPSPTGLGAATSWLVEYKRHVDSTWLTGPTVTTNASTVPGLISSTSYDFRLTAINAAGSSSASSTYTVSTTSIAVLATDVGVSPGGAWSVSRKVVTGYAGNIIKVRRSSDSTTQDIGFDGSGNIDQSALTTFCGAGDGFVDTIYDQSGNTRHMNQTTAGKQPKIVSSGSMLTQGGRAAMLFVSASAQFLTNTSPFAYALAGCAIGRVDQVKSSGTLVPYAEAGTTADYLPGWYNNAIFSWQTRDDSNSAWVNGVNTMVADNSHHQTTSIDTGSAVTTYEDGVLKINAASAVRTSHTVTLTRSSIGAWATSASAGNLPFDGLINEVVIFPTLTTLQRQTLESNQKSYYATP